MANECYNCGCWDSEREGCTMPSVDMWYACPIESKKPENQKALKEYVEYIELRESYKKAEEVAKELVQKGVVDL